MNEDQAQILKVGLLMINGRAKGNAIELLFP